MTIAGKRTKLNFPPRTEYQSPTEFISGLVWECPLCVLSDLDSNLLARLSHFDANGVSRDIIRAGMRDISMRGRAKAHSIPARLWPHRHKVERSERDGTGPV
jgi:hypothetical protein